MKFRRFFFAYLFLNPCCSIGIYAQKPCFAVSEMDVFSLIPINTKNKRFSNVKGFCDYENHITKLTARGPDKKTKSWDVYKIDSGYLTVRASFPYPGNIVVDSTFHINNKILMFRMVRNKVVGYLRTQVVNILEKLNDSTARLTMFGDLTADNGIEAYIHPTYVGDLRKQCFEKLAPIYLHTIEIGIKRNADGIDCIDITGGGFNTTLFWSFYSNFVLFQPLVINRGNRNIVVYNEILNNTN